ncbi:unnamed protein product [Closterium sp. Yama58-4]|nr:unnamed protein product [Closterium sp. Yama58-4]
MVTAPSTRDSLLVVIMARLLTALALLLAFTVTLASFASTAAARSFRLPGNGASGAVETAGGVITAESAPSFAEPSAGDEQDRRELFHVTPSNCVNARNKDCSKAAVLFWTPLRNARRGATDPAAAKCSSE